MLYKFSGPDDIWYFFFSALSFLALTTFDSSLFKCIISSLALTTFNIFLLKCVISSLALTTLDISLFQCIISSLALTTFAVARSKIENRLQLSIMLVLVTVTFKFVTNQVIPKISYMTHLVSSWLVRIVFFNFAIAKIRIILVTAERSFYTRLTFFTRVCEYICWFPTSVHIVPYSYKLLVPFKYMFLQ